MRFFLTVLASSSLFLASCGQNVTPSDSTSKALVSQAQAEKAFEIVAGIDYIPFAYIEDGCYARSLYMSMELAAQGIPSSAHYIYGNLTPTASVSWWYHVAPLLKVEDDVGAEPWILDPAFEKEPLRRSEWIANNDPQGRYTTEVKAGSAYFDEAGRTSEFNANNLISNFEEMPTFLTSDISHACSTMYSYLAQTANNSTELRALRSKLLTQTAALAGALNELGKLESDGISSGTNSGCRSALAL